MAKNDIDELVKDIKEELQEYQKFVANYIAKESKKILADAYDDMILAYYESYAPKYYIRTDTQHTWYKDPDSKYYKMNRTYDGINLYRALNKNGRIGTDGKTYDGTISLDASLLNSKKYGASADEIFDFILDGTIYRGDEAPAQAIVNYPYKTQNGIEELKCTGTILENLTYIENHLENYLSIKAVEAAKKSNKFPHLEFDI